MSPKYRVLENKTEDKYPKIEISLLGMLILKVTFKSEDK